MPTPPRTLRKQFPKQQGILDGIFEENELQTIRDAQDDISFQSFDLDIATDYCCPSCGFEWSGQPKPSKEKEKKS